MLSLIYHTPTRWPLLPNVMLAIMASIIVVMLPLAARAQSTDRDNPTPLTSGELKGGIEGDQTEYFFSFTGGPGEVTVTFDVKAAQVNAGAHLDIFDMRAHSLLNILAQGVNGGSERRVESLELGKRQQLLLRIKGLAYGTSGNYPGTYMVRLAGAVSFAGTVPITGGPVTAPAAPSAVNPLQGRRTDAMTQSGRPSNVARPGAPAQSLGKFYALIIGNNRYVHLPPLKTAENDAKAVDAQLRERYGFEAKLLLNATRQQIISALSEYRQVLAPDDSLLIYYAGHGFYDRDVEKAYWLPVDASKDNPSNWISADDVTSSARGISARHVLVVSDSCYSGTLVRGLGTEVVTPTGRESFLQKMSRGKSRTLIASGGNEPVADGGGGGHSVFAAALLRGLAQNDREMFTAGELFRDHLLETVAGGANQTPEHNPLRNSGHESGDFVFVRRR